MKTGRKIRNWRPILGHHLVVLIAAMAMGAVSGITNVSMAELPDSLIVRVYFNDLETARRIAAWIEPMESKYEKGYLVLEVTPRQYNLLLEADFVMAVDEAVKTRMAKAQETAQAGAQGIPGYPCYRTVEETYAAAEEIATDYPVLADWTAVGNSWEKREDLGGYDMRVLLLTNAAIVGPKPKIFITSAIHGREYTTAELTTRLAEYLVNNYGLDADATWLLNYHEIHLMLQTNPDGRKKAETGLLWRKNTNQNYCGPNSNARGADLNRNFRFNWNCCGGSSGFQCAYNFHGPSPGSEPETQTVQNYIFTHFKDQRGENINDAAPLNASGLYLDIHSSGRLILWPWGFTSDPAPNATQLQTLGRKLAFFNGHTSKQSYGLYPNDGTTISFAYGEMGLAAFIYELGTEFFESCSYFENTIVRDNIPSLIYAIKAARAPYMEPAGPEAVNLALNFSSMPPGIPPGTPVTLSATIDDALFNTNNGNEPAQTIIAAEYYIDVPPWDNPGLAAAMSPADDDFNSTAESVEATIDTTGLSKGQHIIFVRGRDANGNWGVFSAIFLYIG